jgi:hypothetical protein
MTLNYLHSTKNCGMTAVYVKGRMITMRFCADRGKSFYIPPVAIFYIIYCFIVICIEVVQYLPNSFKFTTLTYRPIIDVIYSTY